MDKFQNSLPMMLHRTLDSVIPRYRAIFKQHNISEQQWRILRVLWESDRCTTAELASKTLLPSPSMVGIIDRMISKELIIRDRSKEDRRRVYVSLTDKARTMQATLVPQIDEVYKNMMNQCDSHAWKTMIETMQVIIDSESDQNQAAAFKKTA